MSKGPLAGIRVIDWSHEWACPHAARLLADFGAEVIKIEFYRRLDHMRGGRKENKLYNKHARFLQLNRNKRSLALDLKQGKDRDIFEDLLRKSDVVLSNSRPGVLKQLGYSYSELCQYKSNIILVTMTACGYTGPDASYAGYGGGLEATSGVQSLTAYQADGEPKRIREMDVTNGVVGAAAIMVAINQRYHTGYGTCIDLSELEAPIHSLIGEHVMEYAINGDSALPIGNRDADEAPHGCYRCQGNNEWIAIAVSSYEEWTRFCNAIEHPEWNTDPRFESSSKRIEHHDELDQGIAEWCAQRSKFDAMQVLQKSDISAGAVLNAADLKNDPHLAAREYFKKPSDVSSAPKYTGGPFHIAGNPCAVRHPGPELAEGNQYVVCDLLGRPLSDVPKIPEDEIHTDFDIDDG